MATPHQIVRYFRDCYEADNRETGIANLFSKKFRHVTFLSGAEDLLRGVLDRVPLDRERAIAAQKEAALYRKDKTLVYCAFFLVGRPGVGRLPKHLCAPLLFYPATIVDQDATSFVSVDWTQQHINFPVLAALAGDSESSQSLAEDLLKEIAHPPFRQEDIYSLISLLTDFLPGIEALPLVEYPRLVEEKQVRRTLKSSGDAGAKVLTCLPACAVALIPNSPNTRGVLFELSEMADGDPLSKPVEMLLQCAKKDPPAPGENGAARVPAVLSHSQQRVLTSARSAALTMVVGPPGTGKSYTIAALALDHLARGESVLVASRMNHSVDVVARKIEEMIGPNPCILRGGRKEYLRDLKRFLGQILHGIMPDGHEAKGRPWRLRDKLAAVDREIARLETRLEKQTRWARQWGAEIEAPEPETFVARFLRKLTGNWKLRRLDRRLGKARPLWKSTRRYHDFLEERSRLIAQLLRETAARQIQLMLRHHRREMHKFLQAIRARSDVKQEKLFSQVSREVLFGTFPIWLTTVADVSEVLPLESELFDLVILDEATQCDIAGCLPVLQRARRAVVVGDPHQLRHVSFLSRKRQETIGRKNGLDQGQQDLFPYREKSILDLAGDAIPSQRNVLFLDEHYRSMPRIIRFSNEEFYAGALNIMTERPETAALDCVTFCHVADGQKVGGMNDREAQVLVDRVAERVEAEAELPEDLCHSLGVLSPFRDQVDHLFALIQSRLPLDSLHRHKLMVGTAHTFQGEERDIMYLSLAVDSDTHPASFRFLNNPNVFNVSITRARNEQYVFCSLQPEVLGADTLLRRYLASISGGTQSQRAPLSAPRDVFLRQVSGELQQRGFHAWPAYPLAGMKIDLIAEKAGKTLGIDLIGYPGRFAPVFDLERYRMLQRAGLPLFPLSYYAWSKDRSTCIEAIQRWHGFTFAE